VPGTEEWRPGTGTASEQALSVRYRWLMSRSRLYGPCHGKARSEAVSARAGKSKLIRSGVWWGVGRVRGSSVRYRMLLLVYCFIDL
jgi:hypothetical protein